MTIPYFDQAYYLRTNKDVQAAVLSGSTTAEAHFTKFGAAEKRNPNGYFDANYYLAKYSDVATAVTAKKTTAYDHFINNGIKESRDPSAFFDTNYYLKNTPDVAVLVYRGEIKPFEYFAAVGSIAGQTPSPYFNQTSYLSANPDVRASIAAGLFSSAYDHFVNFGIAEGRNMGNGINLAAFKSDKVFTDAIFAGQFSTAYARVAQIAPFLSTFTLPSNSGVDVSKLTVPTDFTPVTGQLLYIPVGLDTTGKTLPGYFINVNSPKITSSVPLDNATGFDPKADISITFNKEVQLGASGSLYLYKSDGTLVEVFTVKSSLVKTTTTKLTINPTDDLLANGSYYIKMDAGYLKDKDGNNFAGIADSTTLNFGAGQSLTITNTGGQITASGVATATLTADLTAQTINSSAIGGNAANNIDLSGVTSFGANVTGNIADNVIVGTRLADTINGGEGFDTITGGAGANSFVFTTSSTRDATSTRFDTITDWRAGTDSKIDFSSDLILGTQVFVAGAGVATIGTKGVATFNAADNTLALHLAAAEAAIAGTTRATVIWQEGSDAFLFISDGTAGLSTTDVLIKLTGVSVGSGITIAGGDITLIG
jgi:hypothetical protein